MNDIKINPQMRMWRTLVRVFSKPYDGVWLIVPARDAEESVWCPRKAIPPIIFNEMKTGKRYHVECNIGAENRDDLCFDRWENK